MVLLLESGKGVVKMKQESMIGSATLIEEYEINRFTMMIMPESYGSKIFSKVYELEDEFISPFKPIDIVKKSCVYYGASFDGRKEGTRELIGVTHKAPIAIDPTNNIYVFPTTSPNRPQCIWIAPEHVLHHQRIGPSKTFVIFRNKQEFELSVPLSTFESQLHRTARLQIKLMQRIEETERKSLYFYQHPTKFMKASEKGKKYEKLQSVD